MRGIPLLEIVFIAILFALVAVPLAKLTSTRKSVSHDSTPVASHTTVPTYAIARFAHPPVSVVLGETPLAPPDFETDLEVDPGSPLLLKISWPEGVPDTAVTLTLEPEGKPGAEYTFWSRGETTFEALVPAP